MSMDESASCEDLASTEPVLLFNKSPVEDWSTCSIILEETYTRLIAEDTHQSHFLLQGQNSFTFLTLAPNDTVSYRAVDINDKESKSFQFELCQVKSLMSQIRNYYPQMNVIQLHHTNQLSFELCQLEKRFPTVPQNMTIAVLYVRDGQNEPTQWFKNGFDDKPLEKQFWNFLSALGTRVALTHWEGFMGGLSNANETFYTHFKGRFPCIFHVAPMLDDEAHRGLIGNDVSVIVYLEENASPFAVQNCTKLGRLPHNWCIVQPHKDNFKHTFFLHPRINPNFPPNPPSGPINAKLSAELVLTKCFNSQVLFRRESSFKDMFVLPRRTAISQLATKYLERNTGEREKSKERREGSRSKYSTPTTSPIVSNESISSDTSTDTEKPHKVNSKKKVFIMSPHPDTESSKSGSRSRDSSVDPFDAYLHKIDEDDRFL